jgi:hypothetical protein
MLAGEIASQGFRVAPEIAEHGGVVELHRFAASDLGNVWRKSLWNAAQVENQLGGSPAKGSKG